MVLTDGMRNWHMTSLASMDFVITMNLPKTQWRKAAILSPYPGQIPESGAALSA